ncbi:alpha/beta hydrolase [Marinibaculum pumilum]|uniref:Alpha/beta hydrolase n=1 Tax=Marinibaculum pumilum TaxID=1766165 RepID=A0ABV7L5G8_9PROT
MTHLRRAAAAVAALLVLAGCAGASEPPAPRRADPSRLAAAAEIAGAGGLQPLEVPAPPFRLLAYARVAEPPPPALAVYLEGDGLAWESRTRLSADPTPRNPLGLRLAAADPAPSVAWLARPCQYRLRLADGAACPPAYWSGGRFAPETVAAMNRAVDRLKARAGTPLVQLIGYSGGGGLAVLMAAARDDVAALVTVAGNLDHRAWTAHHRVTPLAASLNPADAAAALADVPQLHLVGAVDDVVPRLVADSYLGRLPAEAPGALLVVAGQGHDCCWAETWPATVGQARHVLAGLRDRVGADRHGGSRDGGTMESEGSERWR